MIIVDMTHVMVSNLMVHLNQSRVNADAVGVTPEFVRHLALKSIHYFKSKFRTYGEIVLSYDARFYWRKQAFPHYKAGRKKDRETSGIDWAMIHETTASLKEEFAENMPYKVIQVALAESDDIIATLVKHVPGQHMIIAGDKDFIQLQSAGNVQQYAPVQKKFVKSEFGPDTYKIIHMISGDRGDGIPNFLSADDAFVNPNARQAPLRQKVISSVLEIGPENYCKIKNDDQLLKYFKRNQQLIDFDFIPVDLVNEIKKAYDEAPVNSRSKVIPYLMKHRMINLMDKAGEF